MLMNHFFCFKSHAKMTTDNNLVKTGDARNSPGDAISDIDLDYENFTERTPLLSILCITYNHEKYIGQAIDSFLMQETYFPIEIVIGDDCSKDGTSLIIENYKKKHPSLVRIVTSKSNVGFVENFRRTLNACKGRYIAICEGDDYWIDKQKVQIQVEFLESHPEYVITYHDACPFDEAGASLIPQLSKEFQRDATEEELIKCRPISTLTACFRNVLPDIPDEFNHTPVLDLCIWSLLGNFGKGKHLSNIKPAAYRVHEGGIFSTQSIENKKIMTMHALLHLSRYYERIGNNSANNSLKLQIAMMANSRLSLFLKFRLVATKLDSLFGSPIYRLKRLLV